MSVFSKACLVLGLAVLSVAPATFAQTQDNRNLEVYVGRITSPVTYNNVSSGGQYVVGYTIEVRNKGNNTLQNVKIYGVTSVEPKGSDTPISGSSAVFRAGSPSGTCEKNGADQKAVCTISQMAGNSSQTIAVFFTAPQLISGENEVEFRPDQPAAACFNECKNDAPGSADNDTLTNWNGRPDPVALGTSNPSVIESALTPEGGKFYTGTGLVTVPTIDNFAIQVEVPGQEKFSTIKLNEGKADSVQCTATKNFVTCLNAEVTIDGVEYSQTGTAWLTIKVQIDGANLLPSFKPNRVVILYQPGLNGNPWYATTPCPLDSNNKPRALTDEDYPGYSTMPCLAYSPEAIGGTKGKDKTMPTYVYTFLSRHNGGFAFF